MIWITTIILLFIGGGGAGGSSKSKDAGAHERWPAGEAVVLHTTAVADGLRFCSRNSPAGISAFWEVPARDIPAIDAALHRHLRSSGLDKQLTLPIAKYERQFIGFSRGESRFVYIHAFAARFLRAKFDPAKAIPRICDGGTLSWGIEYDTKARSFSAFSPNGGEDRPRAASSPW